MQNDLKIKLLIIVGITFITSCNNKEKKSNDSAIIKPVIEKKAETNKYFTIESKSQLTENMHIYDTINDFVLQRINDFKMYDGSIKNYVYVNNGTVAYATKEQWRGLREINKSEYVEYESQSLDTVSLPRKENGKIVIDEELKLKDVSTDFDHKFFDTYAYFFNRELIIFSELGYHRTTYYAYNYKSKKVDTLLGKPIIINDLLACFDDQIVTDSKHSFKLFEYENDLNLISEFSIDYLFRIKPREIVLINDSTINFKQEIYNSENKYWKYKF